MRSPDRPSLSITLPKSVYDWIDSEAVRTNRSRSQMIAVILQAEIERDEQKHKADPASPPPRSVPPCSPLDYVMGQARLGIRTLGLESESSPGRNQELLSASHPRLLNGLELLAQETPADPASILPFDERFWPFPLDELKAIRSLYTFLWYEARK